MHGHGDHEVEVVAAGRIAADFGVAGHVIVPIDLRVFGGSALTSAVPVPKDRTDDALKTGFDGAAFPSS